MTNKKTIKRRLISHLGRVSLALISVALIVTPGNASTTSEPLELVGESLGNEGGRQAAKEAMNSNLKMAKSKPNMTLATRIICVSCVPAAGASASPAVCIACKILIAKTLG